jgi:hypothetical protein
MQGNEPSLVVYALEGKVLADYKLEELLPAEEIATKVMRTVSSRWRTNDAPFEPSEDGRSFTRRRRSGIGKATPLQWQWLAYDQARLGRVITVDLATGRISHNG